MKAENRTYKVTYFDGTKEEIVGTENLPPQSQVRSIRLVKGKQPPQSAKNNAEWLLKQNLYNVAGSDMHNVLILKKIGESTFSTDTIKRLTELLQKKL
jgi:hypothetical protein